MLRARTRSGFVPGPGERVFARIDPVQAHFFDTASAVWLPNFLVMFLSWMWAMDQSTPIAETA
jgi:hypothetical protein